MWGVIMALLLIISLPILMYLLAILLVGVVYALVWIIYPIAFIALKIYWSFKYWKAKRMLIRQAEK